MKQKGILACIVMFLFLLSVPSVCRQRENKRVIQIGFPYAARSTNSKKMMMAPIQATPMII